MLSFLAFSKTSEEIQRKIIIPSCFLMTYFLAEVVSERRYAVVDSLFNTNITFITLIPKQNYITRARYAGSRMTLSKEKTSRVIH